MARTTLPAVILFLSSFLVGQDANVQGTVNVLHHSKKQSGSASVVVWLAPAGTKDTASPGPTARLLQKDKRFTPHLLAITVGTAIEFPNRDPFFHDVFSIYHGKPFDLGLYESGAVRAVKFTKPGVSYIFCNIHPEMSAVVVALSTPYFATTARDGTFHIANVPPGQYKLTMWYEFASPSELSTQSRDVTVVAGDNTLPTMTLHASDVPAEHLNKYGEVYTPDKASTY